jgi:hypothetical protein
MTMCVGQVLNLRRICNPPRPAMWGRLSACGGFSIRLVRLPESTWLWPGLNGQRPAHIWSPALPPNPSAA